MALATIVESRSRDPRGMVVYSLPQEVAQPEEVQYLTDAVPANGAFLTGRGIHREGARSAPRETLSVFYRLSVVVWKPGGLAMDPLTCITNFVFYETGLKRSDVILVPGGSRQQLMERAADLYHRGLAPVILPSRGPNPRIPEYASEWEFLAGVGASLGVPHSAILREDRAANTFENARLSLEVLTAAGIRAANAIIVCKTYHAMRAYMTCASVFPPEVEFHVSPVVDDRDIRRGNWFLDPDKTAIVLGEVEKIGRYFPSEVPVLVARREAAKTSTRARAAILVIREGKIAVVRRVHATGKTYYLFPGGHVEPGESLEQAAVREAREELGSYTPVWMALSDLPANDVRPRELAITLAASLSDADLPVRIRE